MDTQQIITNKDNVRAENELILALIATGGNDEAYDRAIRNIDLAAATNSDELEGNCAYTLGRAAHELGQLSVAVMAYARAAGKAMKLGNSKVFGDIQISLATSYLEMFEGDRKKNLEKAIACQNMALDTCTEGTRPLDYAKLQYNMGYAYAELATRFGESFHDHAQRCFDNAVRTFRNLGQLVDARKAEEASRQIKRRFYDTVEQPNRTIKSFATIFWLFWRFCLFVPFFVQLHMMIKFGIISHISFLTRAFLFLPYYVFIEIGIRYIKRHEVVLSKHLLKSLGISGILGAFIGAVFGYGMNSLIINYSGVSKQFLTIYSLMWAPFGIHILYVLKTLFLRSVNGSRGKWVKGSKLD